ncbi:MAG: right-handed parallel beta-helix repeat-containing protein, partial [Thermoplasmata archaeon]|nr:right-handed parallel beta-helix repeat-containing protein [Thermoplasmata archaeon]
PGRASDNPEDVRARMPLRPTPYQHETKFPPPQQSPEEEARKSNQAIEPDLLHGEPAVLLNGDPFPPRKPYDPKFPEAKRMRYVSADAAGPGDGSAEHPWSSLQDALCRLEPGDRLLIASGIYAGSFRIGTGCQSGTAEAPIQVFARHAFLKAAPGGGDVLTIERAHWQLWEVQLALLDADVAGLVTSGPGAHDIEVDQSHIYEGEGPAVVIKAGSDRVTLSNCHIHQSKGVRIESGASHVTLRNDHIHHNRAASVTIGGGNAAAPASDIVLEGNRIHNDHGPGLDLGRCENVSLSGNRFSNYRPDPEEGRTGEAIRVGAGCRDVVFSGNTVLEASIAVRIGPASSSSSGASASAGSSAAPPERILFARNYFQNQLTPDSTGFAIDRSSDVRISNNVIDHYAVPFQVGADARSVTIANNLIVAPGLAFRAAALGAFALFDYNVFGADPGLKAAIGTGSVGSEAWMKGPMPHTRLVAGAGVAEGDLGKVVGFSAVDGGRQVDGVTFQGRAPDIGVAEK